MLLLVLAWSGDTMAKCASSFLNPVSDVNWQCAFPMNIGGVVSFGVNSDNRDSDTELQNPLCSCLLQSGHTLVGATVAFWEPSRLIETVKDPYCFPSIGSQLANLDPGSLQGGSDSGSQTTSMQAHYYIFPVWAMLDMFLDVPCLAGNRVDGGGAEMDLAVITEVLPNWNNDLLAFLLNPEALLFSNPATLLSCMADAASQANGKPIDALYWCMGGWNGVYPTAGKVGAEHMTEASGVLGGRLIYQIGRLGALLDHGIDECVAHRTWIWRKSNYRFHFAQPVRGSQCLHYGSPTPTWERKKNKPTRGDNFTQVIFRRVRCCLGY